MYRLYPQIRDIVVEGREDVRFFSNYLRDTPELAGANYNVYAVGDRIDLPAARVFEFGLEDGARGRVLALATIATQWLDAERQCLTCIADSDRAAVKHDVPPADVLLITDFGSLECYALTPRAIGKLLAVVLALDEPTADDLIQMAIPILQAVFCARAALHFSDSGFGLTADIVKAHKLEQSDLDVSMTKRALPDGRRGEELYLSKVQAVLLSVREKINTDEPRRFIRGHDIAPVVVNLLRLRNRWADYKILEAALMGCIERSDIEDYPLFRSLVSRVGSDKTSTAAC